MPPTPKKQKPIILAVASDLHAGSTLGLCPATFPLDEGRQVYIKPRPALALAMLEGLHRAGASDGQTARRRLYCHPKW